MCDTTSLFILLLPRPLIHHPVLMLPLGGYQGLVGTMHWGA